MAKYNDRPLIVYANLASNDRFLVSDESETAGNKDKNISKAELEAGLSQALGGGVIPGDVFSDGFVAAGLLASAGSAANELDLATGRAYLLQVGGSLLSRTVLAETFTASVISTTYYLDLNPDGTVHWGTAHSLEANYLALAEAITNGSGNITTISDRRDLVRTLKAAENLLPAGGTIGQVLKKISGANYAATWETEAAAAALAVKTAETATAYTLVLADANKYLPFDNAAAQTLSVPSNATVAFAIGDSIILEQRGAGLLSVAALSGVTINSRGAALDSAGQYAVLQLFKVATDTWTLTGDLA